MAHSLTRVLDRMESAAYRAGRDLQRVRLVVVTKGVTIDRVREVVISGTTTFGENRIQEALSKIAEMDSAISWHLIGHLQKNKARQAVGVFDLIHSIDDLALARELNRRAEQKGIKQKILIQVNVAGESTKFGVSPEQALDLFQGAAALPCLEVEGLMTIPPFPEDPADSRPTYRRLSALAVMIKRETGLPVPELSMGMSGDFETAIEEGATLVRVGTAVFN